MQDPQPRTEPPSARRRWLRTLVVVSVFVPGLLAARVGPQDRDADGIADPFDPFPDDPERPGRTQPNTIYANTASELYSVSADGRAATRLAGFTFADGIPRSVTDIAVDPWGVLWASTFDAIAVCHPQTGRCEVMQRNAASINGLEHARASGDGLALYGASTSGEVFRIDRDGRLASVGFLGAPSSGDLVPYGDFVAAATDTASGQDELRVLEPRRLTAVATYPLSSDQLYGLARCDDRRIVLLDASGQVFAATEGGDGLTGLTRVTNLGVPWWGASCSPTRFGLAGDPETTDRNGAAGDGEAAIPHGDADTKPPPREREPGPAIGCACAPRDARPATR